LEKNNIEKEIGMKDLFEVIWDKKLFILIITLFITMIAFVYVTIKTPIYEVKSVIRIGSINNEAFDNSKVIEKKLKLIFNVENKNENLITDELGILSNVKLVKNVDEFIEIYTQAFTNEKAIEMNNKIIKFIQDEYSYKIKRYKNKINLEIMNLEEKINYINTVETNKIKNKLLFLDNVELVSIENKLKFNKEKLKEYQKNILNITKRRSKNDTQNMLSAMEILNNQNLILSLQNRIEDLNKSKQQIVNETRNDIKSELEYNIPKSIEKIKNQINTHKLLISDENIKNTELVGKMFVSEYAKSPKKTLIILVSFITALIFSIFILLFINIFSKKD